MANRHGEHIWYELMTTDPDGARAFYEAVVGWTIDAQSGMAGMDYRMINAADGAVGGLMALDENMVAGGARPCWMGYVGVDDVDKAAAAIAHEGGSIHLQPWTIEGVGRIAMVADPQGAPFYIMRGASEETSTAFSPTSPGHCAWNELATTDQKAAHHFYAKLFGWVQKGEMPMGEMGDYCFLTHHDAPIGATMGPGTLNGAPPHWNHYFHVPSVGAAKAAAEAKGGTILMGPHEVPTGDFIIVGTDPQGAVFCLVGGA